MKILIFGVPGSGKTTLAKKLARSLSIPLFHVDELFFEKGWIERDHDHFLKDIRSILNNNKWIIDGNAMRSLEMRYKKANIVVYCRLNRLICLFRVFKRWLSTYKAKKKIDNPDNLTSSVSLKLIKYLWVFRRKYKKQIEHLKNKYPKITFLEIQSKDEMRFLQKNYKKIFQTKNSAS